MEMNEREVSYLLDFIIQGMPFSQRLKLYKKIARFQRLFKGHDASNPDFPGVAALEKLALHFNPAIELDFSPKQLAGKCLNGAERDHGTITHAVNSAFGAICGIEPGRHSVGWVEPFDDNITCKKCLKRISELEKI